MPPPGCPLHLLIVDDDRDTVDSLAILLRLAGHEVSTADSGPAGLQAAMTEKPDAVTLDLGLPGINGYEVARRIREKSDQMLLIAMTGYGQPEARQRSKAAGFDYHLVKPVDPAELQNLLAEWGRKARGHPA